MHWRLVLAIAVALSVAACATDQRPSGAPGVTDGPRSTSELPGSFGPPPIPTQPDDASPVVLDGALLQILPDSVGGFEITEAPDEAAIALSDPALSSIATAVDVGVAVDTATGNLVTAHVVRLREGAMTDALFRQWRDSYDEGACLAAGGVGGHAEATIDERTVFITNCAAGLLTYHLWLADDDLLISASSIGEARFGEQLMDNLRVPA